MDVLKGFAGGEAGFLVGDYDPFSGIHRFRIGPVRMLVAIFRFASAGVEKELPPCWAYWSRCTRRQR